jgi:hypothetical protein
LATVARELFRFDPADDELPDLFDDEPPLDLPAPERPLLADLRDAAPDDDDELFDPTPEDELLPLFALLEPFDEFDRAPPLDVFDEPADLRPVEDDDADFDRPDDVDELRPDFDRPPPLSPLVRKDELFPLDDRPPAPMFSAAAPTAPIAAPAAAPVMISPATSITLSTIFDELVRREPEDRRFDEDDEDELLFLGPLELLLVAITFPPK